jgi:hypothetical protein
MGCIVIYKVYAVFGLVWYLYLLGWARQGGGGPSRYICRKIFILTHKMWGYA